MSLAKCHSVEFHSAKRHSTDCHSAQCHSTECHSSIDVIPLNIIWMSYVVSYDSHFAEFFLVPSSAYRCLDKCRGAQLNGCQKILSYNFKSEILDVDTVPLENKKCL